MKTRLRLALVLPLLAVLAAAPAAQQRVAPLAPATDGAGPLVRTSKAPAELALVGLEAPGLAALTITGPDADGYVAIDETEPGGPAYDFVDIATAALEIIAEADDAEFTFALPFPFPYYGGVYADLTATTNGMLATATGVLFDYTNDPALPATPSSGGGARIYGYHDDLISTVYAQTQTPCLRPSETDATYECVVVQWEGVELASGDAVSFQTVLYPDGEIVHQYRTADGQGASATIGGQNAGATVGLAYAANTAGSVVPGRAVRYSSDDVHLLVDTSADTPFVPGLAGSLADCLDLDDSDNDCSLREALEVANAEPGLDRVVLAITDGLVGDVATIEPTSQLPTIADDDVHVDGTQMVGARCVEGNVPTVTVVLDGSAYAVPVGLFVSGERVTIRGLSAVGFTTTGFWLDGYRSRLGCSLAGLRPDGTGLANRVGVIVNDGRVEVGWPEARNVISANEFTGIDAFGDVDTLRVRNNWIGVGLDGVTAMPNPALGIGLLGSDVFAAFIGGGNLNEGNVISANGDAGIEVRGAVQTWIWGNVIGLGADGATPLGNRTGIKVSADADLTTIGLTPGTRFQNVISSNGAAAATVAGGGLVAPPGFEARDGLAVPTREQSGIYLEASTRTDIYGNLIGTTADGLEARGNAYGGVSVHGATDVAVGGQRLGNVIVDNLVGVVSNLDSGAPDVTGLTVQGNSIGLTTAATGPASVLPNGFGVYIAAGTISALVGGPDPVDRNVVVGGDGGVVIAGLADGTVVERNYLGVGPDGTETLEDWSFGVLIAQDPTTLEGPSNTLIEGNVIANAYTAGIDVYGENTGAVTVRDNVIGLDASESVARPNQYGVAVGGGVSGVSVHDNTISGNRVGVVIGNLSEDLPPATGTVVTGNRIGGLLSDGTTALGNDCSGVRVIEEATGTIVEYNEIAYNGTGGDCAEEGTAGVTVLDVAEAQIAYNDVHDNTGLGIDLGGDGVTPNDPGDVDGGPNGTVNYPVIEAVLNVVGGQADVAFSLSAEPSTTYDVDVFSSPAPDPSGFGEGREQLGFTTVTTDAAGEATGVIPVTVAPGAFVTAITTQDFGAPGQSSEFSAAVEVVADGLTSIWVDGERGARYYGPPAEGVTVDDLAAQDLVRGVPGYYPTAPANLWTTYDPVAGTWLPDAGTGDVLPLGYAFRWFHLDSDGPGDPTISRSVELPFALSTDQPANTEDVIVTLTTEGNRFNHLANPFGQPLDLTGYESWLGAPGIRSLLYAYDDEQARWRLAPPVIGPWEAFRFRAKGPRRNGNPRLLQIPASAAGPIPGPGPVFADGPRGRGESVMVADAGLEAPMPQIAFELETTTADGRRTLGDGMLTVAFEAGASTGFVMDEDVEKFQPPATAYALVGARVGGAFAGYDARPFEAAEIPLAVEAHGAAEAMTLRWDASALPAGLPVTLVDLATGEEVDVRSASEYAFRVASGPALGAVPANDLADGTGAEDRFVLRIGDRVAAAAADVEALGLEAPAPNPTAGTARVAFALPEASTVRLAVFDVRGREVAVLEDGRLEAGRHEATLDGRPLAPGVYVLRLEADGEVLTRRATVVR